MPVRACPAFGKKCNACNKMNHFATCCKSRNVSTVENDEKEINYIENNDEFYIGTIAAVGELNAIAYPWTEKMKVNGVDIPFKVDTGAKLNVLPLSVVNSCMPSIELKQTEITLRAFGGQRIRPEGMCFLNSVFEGLSLQVAYAVVDLDIMPILGLNTSVKLKLVNPSKKHRQQK